MTTRTLSLPLTVRQSRIAILDLLPLPKAQPETEAGVNSPTATVYVDLEKVQAEIRALATLEADWDGEDAKPVDCRAIETSQQLMSKIADGTLPSGYRWLRPTVAPMTDGGVSLTWRFSRAVLWLIIEPGGNNVIFIHRAQHRQPTRRSLSPDEAAGQLLLALGV